MEEDKIYCNTCYDEMTEGYMIHDGMYHYCNDECLYKSMTELQYKTLHDMGYAFWTTFED